MQHLVIGHGEIGKALVEVFKCDYVDQGDSHNKTYDIIHIAIPYTKQFSKTIKEYQKKYQPKYTVIHSTVPVGTSRKLNSLHSPVTGVHPELAESIKTFKKPLAGKGAVIVAKEFEKYFIQPIVSENPDNTEAGKLFALLNYGVNIAFEKEVYEYCEKNNLDYDFVYGEFVKLYNEGYKLMAKPHFQQYELKHYEGKIGGHCIIQNIGKLKTKLSKFVISKNRRL